MENLKIKANIEKARGNGWQADGRDADEQLNELRGNTDHANAYNETNPVLFVYQKDGTTKALSFKEAKQDASELINAGWAHVATLDAKVFVEYHYGQESKAQGRYEAAEKLLDEYGFYVIGDYPDIAYKAIRIAAGLEPS